MKGKNEPVPIFEPIALEKEFSESARSDLGKWHQAERMVQELRNNYSNMDSTRLKPLTNGNHYLSTAVISRHAYPSRPETDHWSRPVRIMHTSYT